MMEGCPHTHPLLLQHTHPRIRKISRKTLIRWLLLHSPDVELMNLLPLGYHQGWIEVEEEIESLYLDVLDLHPNLYLYCTSMSL